MAIRCGDCLGVMSRCMEENSVDAVVTDPPYHLTQASRNGSPRQNDPATPFGRTRLGSAGFMGKTWDGGDIATTPAVWVEALRVLKPSHYLMAFGGTRTWHRLACAIEDAGFECMDTLMWLYAQGFPKHQSKLKPAWEPIIMARKPGSPALPLSIDECRIPSGDDHRAKCESVVGLDSNRNGNCYGEWKGKRESSWSPDGRWPANLLLDEESALLLDGKARFFFCAKSSKSERNAGCEDLEPQVKDADYRRPTGDALVDRIHGCGVKAANHHPTCKPVGLMRWLVKLVARPGDVVLDPFMGSGTTGVACAMEGRKFLGIDQDAEYVEISRRRIAHARLEKTPAKP